MQKKAKIRIDFEISLINKDILYLQNLKNTHKIKYDRLEEIRNDISHLANKREKLKKILVDDVKLQKWISNNQYILKHWN